MIFLLDTNVVSEVARPAPDPQVLEWLGKAERVAISAVSLEEIYFGLAAKPNKVVQQKLERYLEAYCSVLDVTAVIAKHAGLMRGQLTRRGRLREQADMLIAATAAAHGLTLATRNVRDFDGCGVAIHNPFN
jgi:predicted nucleic acid-binding protein